MRACDKSWVRVISRQKKWTDDLWVQVATTAAAQNNLADKLKSSDAGTQLTTNLKSEAGLFTSPHARALTQPVVSRPPHITHLKINRLPRV